VSGARQSYARFSFPSAASQQHFSASQSPFQRTGAITSHRWATPTGCPSRSRGTRTRPDESSIVMASNTTWGPSTVFAPENELEQALLCTASNSSAAPELYRHLLESNLIVLGTMGERLALDTVKNELGFFHPIFTSQTRLDVFRAGDAPSFQIWGRALLEATRGAQFIINPRSDLTKTLMPEEISWCLENFRNISIAVLKPQTYPTKLIKALCVLFTNRRQLHTARLTYVATQGSDNGAHIVIGIEADGDISRLAQEISAAAAITNPGFPVDVAYLSTQGAVHPLQKHLLTIKPFFERVPTSSTVC
jgi:hypothetical protein